MKLSMGVWNFYFLAKLYLYLSGNIRFDLFTNLLFAVFIIAPLPKEVPFRKSIEIAKTVLSIIIAISLLWRDSWLPSPLDAYAHLSAEGIPSWEYIFSFLFRYFITWEMAIIVAALVVCIVIRNWKFLTPVTLALILISPAFGLIESEKEAETPISLETIFEEARPLARMEPGENPVAENEDASTPSSPKESPLAVEIEKEYPVVGKAPKAPLPPDEEVKEEPVAEANRLSAWTPIEKTDPQEYADEFFLREGFRKVEFREIKKGEEKFDIVFIHICSLSWDDLKGTTVNWKAFFKKFQVLFTNFNAVTAYSGPSTQRLLKANCGQLRHSEIYSAISDECYLFPNLSMLGYKNYFPANHDGIYGNFAKSAKRFARLDAPIMDPAEHNLPARQYLFDNSLVYDDYAALENWWKIRLLSGKERVAAYYNTATLHDGSHWAPKREDWLTRSREVRYNEFLDKLLKDINKFFGLLEASGRNVVVIFVPEHGMALRGSKIQVAGLRDIPLPQINLIPVGYKFFGKRFNNKRVRQRVISKPTSYMALASSLAAMFEKSPFGPKPYDPDYLERNIVRTDHLFENDGVVVVKPDRHYMIFDKRKKWTKLPID